MFGQMIGCVVVVGMCEKGEESASQKASSSSAADLRSSCARPCSGWVGGCLGR
jgi:hypothetical protein